MRIIVTIGEEISNLLYTRVILVVKDQQVALGNLVTKVIKDFMDHLVSLVTEVQLVTMVKMGNPAIMD